MEKRHVAHVDTIHTFRDIVYHNGDVSGNVTNLLNSQYV